MVIVQTMEGCRIIRSGAGNAGDTRDPHTRPRGAASCDADDAIEKRLRDIPYYGSAHAKVQLDLSLESLSAIRAGGKCKLRL